VPDTDAALSSYDDISYAKGASALRQLVAWTGWPAFIAGINDYLSRHRFGSATLDDLLDCLSRASGTDLHAWAARWLRTSGVDTLAVRQDGPSAGPGLVAHAGGRPHQVWIGVYDRAPGDAAELVVRARFPVTVGADAGEVALPSAAVDPPPALLLPNDGDVSYCKVRFDPRSWAALASGLGRLPDPLSRAVAWNAARDLVRDGELPARRYLGLMAAHLPAETDAAIAGAVLGFARRTIADRYLPRPQRGAALAGLFGLCETLLGRAAGDDPGGIRQVAGQGLIDSASRPDDVTMLRSWLEAGRWPGRPDLDSRLRWQIMLRLAVLGAVGRAEIEREAGQDPTAAGQHSAARCRAALPGLDAKQAAWTQMFGPGVADEPSSYQLAATAEGFWQADQADLVAGYVPRYFPALADVAVRRGPAAARVLVKHGYPHHAVTATTLRAGEQGLAGAPFPASLRRLLADELDDLRRALNVSSASG
jgi:aminopeptidase N